MSDSSSQSDSQLIGLYSTPVASTVELCCSLSSISDRGPSTLEKVLASRRCTTENEDEGGISGDTIREHAVASLDIRSCEMEQLFHRTHDLISHKSVYEARSSPKLPTSRRDSQRCPSMDDGSLLDGNVGEHHRTYTRSLFRKKRILSGETQVSLHSKADLLWREFMKDHPLWSPRKHEKPSQLFPTKPARKFFKLRGQEVEKNKRVHRTTLKKKKHKNLYFGYSGLFMPSQKFPLGWMAIKGICYAQRLEVCDGPQNSLDDSWNHINL